MLLALTSALALAGDVDISAAAVWAPRPVFQADRGGAALTVAWQPQRVGLALTAEQRIGPLRRPPIQDQITSDGAFYGDVSPIQRRASLVLDVVALTGTIHAGRHELPLRLHLGAGGGVVETRDDLDALQKTTDPDALATERQVHPTLDLAASLDVGLSKRVLVRAAFANLRYTETLEVDTRFGRSSVAWSLGPTLAL